MTGQPRTENVGYVWLLRRDGRFESVVDYYGYWPTRHAAMAYLTREAGGTGEGGELLSSHVEWFTVEPFEAVDAPDHRVRVKNRCNPDLCGSQSNAGDIDE